MVHFTSFLFWQTMVTTMMFSTFLHGNTQELQPMKVSALRLETPSKNLPARIQVIDQDVIERSGATDVVGLLRKEANLQVRSTSGNSARSTVSMGGFGEGGQLRTLVILDGHRLNTIDMSAINWCSIPLALVESIEVIRGGQSGTYGNHAVGGVIKINTKLPKVEPTGSLQFSTGSFDSFNLRGAYSQKIGEIGLTIFGDRVESDGYRVNGDHQTDSGGLRLDWGGESGLKGYLSWTLSNTDFGFPGDLNASALLSDRRQSTDLNDRGEEKSSNGRGGLSYEINDTWSLENRFGYLDRETGVNMPSASWIADTSYETFSYSPILHYESNSADWMIGFDYFKDEVDADTNYDDSFLQRRTMAVLASTNQSLSELWNWNGNFRLETNKNSGEYGGTILNEVENEEWAGAIGVVREFGSDDLIYGAFRRFYRYPATDEILVFWPSRGLNPNLEPESGFEVELGADLVFYNLFGSGRIFQQWMKDEIIYDSAAGSNVNLEKTRRLGFDLSLEWQLTKSMRSGASYEYVRATIEEGTFAGSRVPLVAEGLLRLFLELSPVDSLLLSLGGSYVGETFMGSDFTNSKDPLGSYWLHDLRLNYELSSGLTFFAGMENIFDEEYVSTAFLDWREIPGFYPGSGRTGRLGFRYLF